MAARVFLAIAGLSGAVAVGLEAAARHLFAADAYRLDLAMTSARYGLIHAVALLGVGALLSRDGKPRCLAIAGWLFVAGLVLFCGSLDLIVAGASHSFVIVTPWGGTAFIAGWVALLVAALLPRRAS
jgi:uncharacterized membrane protein YgdD (TMEM256/DUF423 family)